MTRDRIYRSILVNRNLFYINLLYFILLYPINLLYFNRVTCDFTLKLSTIYSIGGTCYLLLDPIPARFVSIYLVYTPPLFHSIIRFLFLLWSILLVYSIYFIVLVYARFYFILLSYSPTYFILSIWHTTLFIYLFIYLFNTLSLVLYSTHYFTIHKFTHFTPP